MNMSPPIVICKLGVSTSWHDFVPLALFITLGPFVVWGARKLWRMIPEEKYEQETPQHKTRSKRKSSTEPEFRVVEIATFMNDIRADSACEMLKSKGIPSFIRRDDCGGMRPWLRFATGGLQLAVRDVDAQRAASLLKKTMG